MFLYRVVFAAALLAAVTACSSGRHSSSGFRLPAGDVEKGRAAFLALECNRCHQVDGVELPATTAGLRAPVTLGGVVVKEITDGYLVTSIVYPSYKLAPYPKDDIVSPDGKSKMPVYAETITVRQLEDIVAFLQSRYTVQHPSRSYPAYY